MFITLAEPDVLLRPAIQPVLTAPKSMKSSQQMVHQSLLPNSDHQSIVGRCEDCIEDCIYTRVTHRALWVGVKPALWTMDYGL